MNAMPTILLIDDDPDFVEATCAVLESVPTHVVVAYNGQDGLTKARQTQPDLIFLDIIMPGEDGFQILETLKTDPGLAQIPVIMLTSLPNSVGLASTGETPIAAGAYIEKPIKPAELLRRVKEMLQA